MFSERFKEERKKLKLTQQQIADKLGISRSNVANWENGSNMASPEMIIKCSKIFKCSTDYLLGESEYRTIAEEYDEIFKDELPSLRNGSKILGNIDYNTSKELQLDKIITPTEYDFNTMGIPTPNNNILLDELKKLNLFNDNEDITQEELDIILNFIKNNKDMLKKLIQDNNPNFSN